MKKYVELNSDGVAFAMLEVAAVPVGSFVEGDESSLGKKWNGKKFVEVVIPKKYKVWSKTAFVTICGRAVFDAIVDGDDKDLRYFKYILDSSVEVDMNIPEYFQMVQGLNLRGIMSNEIFAALSVQG